MPHKPLALALLALVTALLALPANAAQATVAVPAVAVGALANAPGNAYSHEGACGGEAPIVNACNALPTTIPSGARHYTMVADVCPPSSGTCVGFVGRITGVVMGPSGFFRASCDIQSDGSGSCRTEDDEGAFYPGDEVTLEGWVSGLPLACATPTLCAGGVAIGNWGVHLEFS